MKVNEDLMHILENSIKPRAQKNADNHSNCSKKKVGAVLIGLDRMNHVNLIFDGYGGPVVPENNCALDENGLCPRKSLLWTQDGCWSMHAEERALLNTYLYAKERSSDLSRHNLHGHYPNVHKFVMVVTHGPCDQCIKFMVNAGVDLCVYDIDYRTDYSKWSQFIQIKSLRDLKNGN